MFKIGDKVQVLDNSGTSHKVGDKGIICEYRVNSDMCRVIVNGISQWYFQERVKLVEDFTNHDQRIDKLEKEIESLKEKVRTLEKNSGLYNRENSFHNVLDDLVERIKNKKNTHSKSTT